MRDDLLKALMLRRHSLQAMLPKMGLRYSDTCPFDLLPETVSYSEQVMMGWIGGADRLAIEKEELGIPLPTPLGFEAY